MPCLSREDRRGIETSHAPQGAANHCRSFPLLPQPDQLGDGELQAKRWKTACGFPLWQNRRSPEKVIIAAWLNTLGNGR